MSPSWSRVFQQPVSGLLTFTLSSATNGNLVDEGELG
jgi:hypothetical protein